MYIIREYLIKYIMFSFKTLEAHIIVKYLLYLPFDLDAFITGEIIDLPGSYTLKNYPLIRSTRNFN